MKTINDLNFEVSKEVELYTNHSAEIGIMISNYITSTKGMTKKKFAELVGKTPTDVSRWVSGSHNFTILTISLIESKTGMSIIKNLTRPQISCYRKGESFTLQNEKVLTDKIYSLNREISRLKAQLDKVARPVSHNYFTIFWNDNRVERNYRGLKNTLGGCVYLEENTKAIVWGQQRQDTFKLRGLEEEDFTVNAFIK